MDILALFRRLLAVMLLAGLAIAPAHAAQSYDNCGGNFIASLPAVISTQGTWCMNKDLSTAITSGSAIVISTNNVTIDCNHFKLGGLAAGLGTATNGIYISDKTGITLRNCNIRGFYVGVYFGNGGSTLLIEDNAFYGNTAESIYVSNVDGAMIRRNRISTTGGSTTQPISVAIVLAGGSGLVLSDNVISGVTFGPAGSSDAIGIYDSSVGAVIRGNDISNITGSAGGSYHGFGIQLGQYGKALDNTIDNVTAGGAKVGVYCPTSPGYAKNTVASQLISATSGCTDGGGNALL